LRQELATSAEMTITNIMEHSANPLERRPLNLEPYVYFMVGFPHSDSIGARAKIDRAIQSLRERQLISLQALLISQEDGIKFDMSNP
jgi:hypothetical protein